MMDQTSGNCDLGLGVSRAGTVCRCRHECTARLIATFFLAGAAVLAALWGLGVCQMPTARAATISSVNTTADNLIAGDGYCTLREAIMNANADSDTTSGDCPAGTGADTIILPTGIYTLTLAGDNEDSNATGDLDITGVLTIAGAGASSTRVNANGIDRVFDIAYSAGVKSVVVISRMMVTNGVADYDSAECGGGIRSNWGADVTVAYTEVYSNQAQGPGGGIYHYSGALTVTASRVRENTSSNSTHGSGGGVYLRNAQGSFINTVIGSNSADGLSLTNGGGGLYVWSSQVALIDYNYIGYNDSKYHGGGLYVSDGAAVTQTGTLIVLWNTADEDNAADGGGIYQSGNDSRLVLGTAEISRNQAYWGGGVHVNGGAAVLSGTQVVNNWTKKGCGGVNVVLGFAELTGAAVVGNAANDGRGGGICIGSDASASLSRSYVVDNVSDGDGAGIYNKGLLTVTNSTLAGNETLAAGRDGGALTNDDGTASIIFTTIVSNTAHRCAGGICMFDGGGIVRLQNTLLAYNRVATTVVNCNEIPKTDGHNLEDVNTCGLSSIGDIKNTDPKLGALTDVSGTMVYPLQVGSPAIDAGVCVTGLTTDQRGVARPQGLKCDIGAYEAPPSIELEHLFLPCMLKTESGGG